MTFAHVLTFASTGWSGYQWPPRQPTVTEGRKSLCYNYLWRWRLRMTVAVKPPRGSHNYRGLALKFDSR